MEIVQKNAKMTNGKTFHDISKSIYRQMLNEGLRSKRIDIVFDCYNSLSIKTTERSRRGVNGALVIKNILPGHKIKQFDKFLKSSENKVAFIQFLANEWKKEEYRSQLGDKVLYVNAEGKCWRIDSGCALQITELFSDQEEADTKIILHAKHAADEGHPEILIVTEDTDVHVLGISYAAEI